MGGASFPELCAPLPLWGGIHLAPVTANPPLEEARHPRGGPHLFRPRRFAPNEKKNNNCISEFEASQCVWCDPTDVLHGWMDGERS